MMNSGMSGESHTADDFLFSKKLIAIVLILWAIVWSLLPILTIGGVFFDVAENLEWGRYWQLGYDKHPFVSMWISSAVYTLTGTHVSLYFLSQIFVAGTILCIWRFALYFLKPLPAAAAALSLLSLQYFSSWTLEFNNDVIAILTWSAAMLFFYRAIQKQRIWDWLLTAFLCAVSLMTKYYAVVLLATLFGCTVLTESGRRSFRHAGIYLAVVLGLLLLIPHLLWLIDNDFLPFRHMEESVHIKSELKQGILPFFLRLRLRTTREFFQIVLERLPTLIAPCIILFWKSKITPEKTCTHTITKDDRILLFIAAFGPLLLTLALPLFFGGAVKASWLASCFSFLTVWGLCVFPVEVSRKRLLLLTAAVGICGVFFCVERTVKFVYKNPYRKNECPYEAYPGKAIAEKAEALWKENLPGVPFRYIIADRLDAVQTALMAPSRPMTLFVNDTKISPWCDPEDLKRSGAIVLWYAEKDNPRARMRWVLLLRRATPSWVELGGYEFERATVPWFRKLCGEPKTIFIAYALIPPENQAQDKK